MKDVKQLYSTKKFWPMYPEDERSRDRFLKMIQEFTKVISEIPDEKELSVLDIASGTGIAGIALSKVLTDFGRKVKLTLIDLREDDFVYAEEWMKFAELDLEMTTRALDATHLEKLGEKYDIALLWGHSTPHFSPRELVRLFSSMRRILKEEGTALIQEKDRVFDIFYKSKYRSFLPERNGIVSVDEGYDRDEGCFIRGYYHLDGFKLIARTRVRMWDTPLVCAILEIFFKNVRTLETPDSDIVVASHPRRRVL